MIPDQSYTTDILVINYILNVNDRKFHINSEARHNYLSLSGNFKNWFAVQKVYIFFLCLPDVRCLFMPK